MDLVDTLRKKIDLLDDGDYAPGLKSVLVHVETSYRHLLRGQDTQDETAFTDAIYRTNQAFEGSIKEAYRVLADKDPAKKRPFDIENYLKKNNIFKSRILSQLTTYRTEWRNPSTHDHNLDFDESEAFLAIISVSAFACLLLDQIAERLSFKKSQAEAQVQQSSLSAKLAESQNANLLIRVTELLAEFCLQYLPQTTSADKQSESQIIGALHGFLASAAPELTVQIEARLDSKKSYYADLLLTRRDEKVVVEIKRRILAQGYSNGIAQVERYLRVGGICSGVLLFVPEHPSEMERREIIVSETRTKIIVMTPAGSIET
jgi:hypothetical protein